MAPTMAQAEAMSATGMASRRSAMPFLSRPGPAASAPASATKSPAPLTKSRWKGKEAADDRHEEHAAAHAAQHRHDAEDEGHDEEDRRPAPPGHGAPS